MPFHARTRHVSPQSVSALSQWAPKQQARQCAALLTPLGATRPLAGSTAGRAVRLPALCAERSALQRPSHPPTAGCPAGGASQTPTFKEGARIPKPALQSHGSAARKTRGRHICLLPLVTVFLSFRLWFGPTRTRSLQYSAKSTTAYTPPKAKISRVWAVKGAASKDRVLLTTMTSSAAGSN